VSPAPLTLGDPALATAGDQPANQNSTKSGHGPPREQESSPSAPDRGQQLRRVEAGAPEPPPMSAPAGTQRHWPQARDDQHDAHAPGQPQHHNRCHRDAPLDRNGELSTY